MPGVQPGMRRYVSPSEILVDNTGGASYTNTVARFRLTNPSARLHVKIVIAYEPYTGAEALAFPQAGAGAWLLYLEEWNKTSKGKVLQGNPVIQSLPIPRTYEATTMSDEWRGTVTVPSSGTGIAAGVLHLIGSWEPAAGDNIDHDELQQLFGACRIQAGGIATSQNGGGG